MRDWLKRLFGKKYVYHVVYRFANGSGSTTFNLNKKIKTSEDIKRIAEYIETDNGFERVSVESWMRLSK